jgi:two-component system NtrC family sensor kinase
MSSGGHILLVEDTPTQALAMSHTLERAGFQVTWVDTADGALAVLRKQRPDLIITDYHLPDMLGDELCRLIRSKISTRDIPVILLTVEEAHRLELHALQSGVDDYFEKTVRPSEFLPRIHSLLRKGRGSGRGLPREDLERPRLLLCVTLERRAISLVAGFEEMGVEVRRAFALSEAVDQRSQVDGILLDSRLLAEDRSAAWATLLDREPAAWSPPVMILAPRDDSNAFLLEAGADDVILDEVQPEVLRAKVKNQLLRHRARRENLELESRYREQELRAAMASELEEKNRELSRSYSRLQSTQSQLVHSERMAALGQMVAGMMHEINNPLAFVISNVYNVLGWLKGLDPKVVPALEARETARWRKIALRLSESLEGLERVKDLVLQLRTYSRLDEGDLKDVDVAESIASVLRILNHRLRHQRVELVQEYEFSRPLACHPGAFNQVVMNLVGNALDELPDGGRLVLRTELWEGNFRLLVSDDGPGIPEALRQRIFEPFVTTKPAGKGTGLGLAISRQIVEGHGGTLSLLPRDSGATFAVTIPLLEAARP